MTGSARPASASAISDVKASVHELAYLAGREPGGHRAASGQRGAIRMLSLHIFLGFAAIRQDVSDSVTSTARALADATLGK